MGGNGISRISGYGLAIALLAATLVLVGPSAGAEECQAVDVSLEEDTCGELASASVTGDAEGHGCDRNATCVTASGTGNASNEGDCGYRLDAGCIAVSGTGNATNEGECGPCSLPGVWPRAGWGMR